MKKLSVKTMLIILLLITSMTIFPAAVEASPPVGWGSAMLIEDNEGREGSAVRIAKSGLFAMAVWLQEDGTGKKQLYRNWSIDGGTTWGTEQVIDPGDADYYDMSSPQLAASETNAVMVWSHQKEPTSKWEIRSSYSTDCGCSWSIGQLVEQDAADDLINPQLGLWGGDVAVIWETQDQGNIEMSFSGNGGNTWSPAVTLNTGFPHETGPQLAVSDTCFIPVWVGNDSNIYSDNAGSRQLVNSQIGEAQNPQVTLYESSGIAVWAEGDGTTFGIYSNCTADGGVNWGIAQQVNTGSGNARNPQVATDGTTTAVVWADNSGGSYRIYCASSQDSGNTWENALAVSSGSGDAENPRVAVSGPYITVVWRQFNQGIYRIYSNSSMDGGVHWQGDSIIDASTGNTQYPRVAMDGAGAIAAWPEYTVNCHRIYVNQALPEVPPPPQKLWGYTEPGLVFDLATGKLTGDDNEDVAVIDVSFPEGTLNIFRGEGDGLGNSDIIWSEPIIGLSTAVGDIDGDGVNDIVTSGINIENEEEVGIFAFEGNGTLKWYTFFPALITDIEIDDMNADGINEIFVCGILLEEGFEADLEYLLSFAMESNDGIVCGLDGEGNIIPDWPAFLPGETVLDIATGQLDGTGGVEVAAISMGENCSLRVYDGCGVELWSKDVSGRTVEIGDVDGDGANEVIAGAMLLEPPFEGNVTAYNGTSGDELYTFATDSLVADIEIGDLDGDEGNGVEIACIDMKLPDMQTLYALDIDNLDSAPDSQIMWSNDISWFSFYFTFVLPFFGEAIAIGDVDRDYLNEVVVCSGELPLMIEGDSIPYGSYYSGDFFDGFFNGDFIEEFFSDNFPQDFFNGDFPGWKYIELILEMVGGYDNYIYAFDGQDNNNDGRGDDVWSRYSLIPEEVLVLGIIDLETGDLDGDGDQDVTFGTFNLQLIEGEPGLTFGVYGLAAEESQTQTATGSGIACFDADPSTLENLAAVPEFTLPLQGKPAFFFPHGFFSFEINGLEPGQTAVVTVTLPSSAPVGTKWVTCQNGEWEILPIGSDDGDRVITFEVTDGGIGDADGLVNGRILEPGGPGKEMEGPVGGKVEPVSKLSLILPWVLFITAITAAAGIITALRRMRKRLPVPRLR
ncbi:MAG: hypothetical protein JXA46_16340 [Dehalococcoidales bacterium]|nr:hypothetical protein [Dehalococcoidales bacterium]